MKKIIAFILIITTLVLTLTGCFWREDNTSEEYCWGDEGLGFPQYQDLNAKVTSDELEFNINDVTLDFYYCFYRSDKTIEEIESQLQYTTSVGYCEVNYAVYLSNDMNHPFEKGTFFSFEDCINRANAQLIKYIDHEELLNIDYGYTIYGINVIEYNHMEELTIPAEFFVSSYGTVYIHVVRLCHWVEDDKFSASEKATVGIEFDLLDESTVILRER